MDEVRIEVTDAMRERLAQKRSNIEKLVQSTAEELEMLQLTQTESAVLERNRKFLEFVDSIASGRRKSVTGRDIKEHIRPYSENEINATHLRVLQAYARHAKKDDGKALIRSHLLWSLRGDETAADRRLEEVLADSVERERLPTNALKGKTHNIKETLTAFNSKMYWVLNRGLEMGRDSELVTTFFPKKKEGPARG